MKLKNILLAGAVLITGTLTGCETKNISGTYKGYSTTGEETSIKIGKEFYSTSASNLDTLELGKNYSFTLKETPFGNYISKVKEFKK